MLTQQSLLPSGGPTLRVSPFVKWAGGKTHLTKYIRPLVPSRIRRYYEPFLGGGALFFAIYNSGVSFEATLSDTNQELISTFKVVRDSPREVVHQLSKMKRQYLIASNQEKFYYSLRATKFTDKVELAARFIFLNKTCYNGLYRVNRDGEFNVPFGQNKAPGIFEEDNITAASEALRATKARLVSTDYQRATEDCGSGDFIYLDPPYDPISKTSTFTSYTSTGFNVEDQARLADWFGELVRRGCSVVLSNSDTGLIRALYETYPRRSIPVNRPISCKGSRRTGFRELIIFNIRQ